MRWLSSRYLRTGLAVVGLLVIAITLWTERLPTQELREIGWRRIGAAMLIIAGASAGAAMSWSVLIGREFGDSGMRYLLALPAKHIPGGLGLPLAQLSYETSQGDKPGFVVVRLAQHFLLSVGAGGLVAVGLQVVAGTTSPFPTAVGAILGLGVIAAQPGRIRRVIVILRRSSGEPAAGRAVSLALLATSIALILMGVSYSVILGGLLGTVNLSTVAAAFVLSWAVGYAAVPVPAGIGIREVILVGLLPAVSQAIVIIASLVFRFVRDRGRISISRGRAHFRAEIVTLSQTHISLARLLSIR